MKRKGLLWVVCIAMVVSMFGGVRVEAAGGESVCKIGETEYETFGEALRAVQDGGTIVLMQSIVYNDTIAARDKSFTIDINNNNFEVNSSNDATIKCENNNKLDIVNNGNTPRVGYVNINNTSTGYPDRAIFAHSGSEINIGVPTTVSAIQVGVYIVDSGKVDLSDANIEAGKYGAYLYNDCILNITGDIIATDEGSVGVWANSGIRGSLVTVDGKISAPIPIKINTKPIVEIIPTTKDGFRTFRDTGDSANPLSTVWVKELPLPSAKDVSISGRPIVGETLIGNYIYSGDNLEDGTTFKWLRNNGDQEKIFEIHSIAGVRSGPPNPSIIIINEDSFVTHIMTYHYYNGGTLPGSIKLIDESDGTIYGPWDATGTKGQGGVNNAYWNIYPNMSLPAGNYKVEVSNSSTWSYTSDTGNRGMVYVYGNPTYDGQYTEIDGANSQTYTLDEEDAGSMIKFEVTVRDINGSQGNSVISSAVGPVEMDTSIEEPIFSGGTGTENEPYLISTKEDLIQLSDLSQEDTFEDTYFLQTDNIVLTQTLTPINDFSGTYNGDGKSISNLSIDKDNPYAGLFGTISEEAVLKNISLINLDVEGTSYVGGLVGESKGSIDNCNSKGSVSGEGRYVGGLVGQNTGTISGGSFEGVVYGYDYKVGGLVGRNRGVIQNVTIDNIKVSGLDHVGGLAGRNLPAYAEQSGFDLATGIIKNCHIGANTIIEASSANIGGLVGNNTEGLIEQCSSQATTTGTYRVGGLIGSNSGKVRLCFSRGSVTGTEALNGDTGGLIGYNWGTVEDSYSIAAIIGPKNVGGFIGRNHGTLSRCYSASVVTGTGDQVNISGMIGDPNGGDVAYCYWDRPVSTQSSNAAGTASTTEAMKRQSIYDSWNFDSIWNISSDKNNGYPELVWQDSSSVSSDANLENLTATNIILNPDFDPEVTVYNGSVENSTTGTVISVETADRDASVTIDGVEGNTKEVGLGIGENKIEIIVTAKDGTTIKTYTIRVKRADAPLPVEPPSGGGGGSPSIEYYYITPKASEGGKISPSSEVKVREDNDKLFKITSDQGYEIEDVIVDGKSLGSISEYKFENIEEDHTIEAIFKKVESVEEPIDQILDFEDLDSSAWYMDGINYILEKDLFKGTSETLFEPNARMTRAMLITVLHRLEQTPQANGGHPFIDAIDGDWYQKSIAWASEKGIIEGYSEDIFKPNNPLSREEMAAILYRFASYKGYDISASADLSKYGDADDIFEWALPAMKWAVAEGLIEGTDETRLQPKAYTTRAQVATILMRFIENVK